MPDLIAMPQPDSSSHIAVAARWRLIRDALVFSLKLLLGNLQNFLLLPLALGAAAIDVIFRGQGEEALFYRVLRWGRSTDEAINVYGAIGGYQPTAVNAEGAPSASGFTVDSLMSRVEEAVIRECEKGGTASSVKAAVDRVLDEIQRRGEQGTSGVKSLLERGVTRD